MHFFSFCNFVSTPCSIQKLFLMGLGNHMCCQELNLGLLLGRQVPHRCTITCFPTIIQLQGHSCITWCESLTGGTDKVSEPFHHKKTLCPFSFPSISTIVLGGCLFCFVLCCVFILCFLGPHPVTFRDHSWLCSQISILAWGTKLPWLGDTRSILRQPCARQMAYYHAIAPAPNHYSF